MRKISEHSRRPTSKDTLPTVSTRYIRPNPVESNYNSCGSKGVSLVDQNLTFAAANICAPVAVHLPQLLARPLVGRPTSPVAIILIRQGFNRLVAVWPLTFQCWES